MLSKYTAETMCKFYHQHYGVNCEIIRPFNVYGIGQSKKLLLGSIISQIKKSLRIEVRNVNTSRDFIHVMDLAKAFKLAIEYKSDFEVFNIGGGYSTPISEVINTIGDIIEKDIDVIETNKDYVDPISNCYADIQNAKIKLNWKPTISLREGLVELLEENIR